MLRDVSETLSERTSWRGELAASGLLDGFCPHIPFLQTHAVLYIKIPHASTCTIQETTVGTCCNLEPPQFKAFRLDLGHTPHIRAQTRSGHVQEIAGTRACRDLQLFGAEQSMSHRSHPPGD